MQHLVTSDGTIVLPGAMLHAQQGPHAGTHWRLAKVWHDGVRHLLRCTRLTRVGRAVMDFHPSVFGLNVIEVSRWWRVGSADIVRWWHKIDDGLFMGALALIPLALFEAFHGGEVTRHWLEMIFNSRANGGGGH